MNQTDTINALATTAKANIDQIVNQFMADVENVPADPPVTITTPSTATVLDKINLTNAANPAKETDWQNINIGNASIDYKLKSGLTLNYAISAGIGVGVYNGNIVDADYPNDVLMTRIYQNSGNKDQMYYNFKGCDPSKLYNIDVALLADGSNPSKVTFGGQSQTGDPNKTLVKLSFKNLKPDSGGIILGAVIGAGYTSINALIISVQNGTTGTGIAAPDQGTSTAPVVTSAMPNAEEKLFTNAYYSLGAKLDADGSVRSFPDVIAGNDMVYVGVEPQTLDGLKPLPIDGGLFTKFENRPLENYHSAVFTPVKQNYEIWYVSRKMPDQSFEAMAEGSPISGYLGNDGNAVRAIFNNVDVPGATRPPFYQVVIERLVIKPGSAAYWQNGELQGIATDLSAGGKNTAQSIADNTTRSINGIGTYTNCQAFDFAAMYFKAGLFSDADATTIYKSLAAKFGAGLLPNQILLSNICWTNTNGVYTPSASIFKTPAGTTVAPIANWKYNWYVMNDFSDQRLFSTNRVIKTADIPAGYSAIKCRMMPLDTNGNGWRYFSTLMGSTTQVASEIVF